MRRPGEALTRQTLLEHVWDFAFDGDPNIVDVYVGYLRAKIDRPFERASIETVRGIGYRLRDEPPHSHESPIGKAPFASDGRTNLHDPVDARSD
jgi:DNA-binding winged helix-turn-helix (wHTH) protein